MHWRRTAVMLALSGALVSCAETAPTVVDTSGAPSLSQGNGNGKGQEKREEKREEKARARAALLTDMPIAQGEFAGTLSISRIDIDPETRQLLFSGRVTQTSAGATQGVTDIFTRVAGTLVEDGAGAMGHGHGGMVRFAAMQGPAEPNACDILFLDLGPLHLNLLGVVLDLNEVVLDLDAVAGTGNLLGNLLCALLGLLDGVALLASILQILDLINAILGALPL